MALVLRYMLPPVSRDISPAALEMVPLSFTDLQPVSRLFSASTLRAWAVFSAIAFFPPLLISRGYDLFTADLLVTVMLFAGVAGQLTGGYLADRYGKKEFTIAGLLCSVPFLALFLGTEGTLSILSLIIFGFFLWSNFAVTVAMSHELLPRSVGMASGLMLGVAIGAGGIGVAVSGYLADRYSLMVALALIPVLLLAAAGLMLFVRYPWKSTILSP
jgi:FSR family fosmidomycin resistance protein-like MFS transporter